MRQAAVLRKALLIEVGDSNTEIHAIRAHVGVGGIGGAGYLGGLDVLGLSKRAARTFRPRPEVLSQTNAKSDAP